MAEFRPGEGWTWRHAGLLRKYHKYPYGYAEIASRYESEDPFMGWPGVVEAWDKAKTAWWEMFRAFFIDTSLERGPRNDWILPDDVYPPLPRVPPWIVQSVTPAYGWPELLAQVDEQLEEVQGWAARPSGQLVEVTALKPPQKIVSTNDDGARREVDYQQLLYRLSSDFVGSVGNTQTWTMLMQAVLYRKFESGIPVIPSFGEPWIDFANDTYADRVRAFVVSHVNLIILHMEYAVCHLQETDLTNTGKGAYGGLVGEGQPDPTGGDGDEGFAGGTDGEAASFSGSVA